MVQRPTELLHTIIITTPRPLLSRLLGRIAFPGHHLIFQPLHFPAQTGEFPLHALRLPVTQISHFLQAICVFLSAPALAPV